MDALDELARLERKLGAGTSVAALVSVVLDLGALVHKNPFPDVVTACVQLLAKLFVAVENFVRTRIVATLREASRHLDADSASATVGSNDTLMPIVHVLDSNDPVARSLTLETLGHLSCLLASRDDVQFRVLERLDSTSHLEAMAALFAVERVLPLSESFAAALVKRALPLIESDNTARAFKLGLIGVLGLCRGAAASAAKEKLLVVLRQWPAEAFVVSCLRSLTSLATLAQAQLEPHVDVLLATIQNDNRPLVQLSAVHGLVTLVRACPVQLVHRSPMWIALLAAVQRQGGSDAVVAALLALVAFAARHWSVSSRAINVDPVCAAMRSPVPRIRKWALRAMSRAAVAFPQTAGQQLYDYCVERFAATDLSTPELASDFERGSTYLRACLALMLVDQWSTKTFEMVLLQRASAAPQLLHWLAIAAPLCAHHLPVARRESGAVPAVVLEALAKSAEASAQAGAADTFAAALVCYMRLRGGMARVGALLSSALNKRCDAQPEWRIAMLRVAREAGYLQLHATAAPIWLHLASKYFTAERPYRWAMALYDISRGEVELQNGRVPECCILLRHAVSLLTACGGQYIETSASSTASVQSVYRVNELRFQRMYIMWRIALLECHVDRVDLLAELQADVDAISAAFADLDPLTRQFLNDAHWCLGVLSGASAAAPARLQSARGTALAHATVLTSHYCAMLAAPGTVVNAANRADFLSGFRLASAALPRYFFTINPRVAVELSIVKPRALEPWQGAQWDTGHAITVDGVIRVRPPMHRFRAQSVEVHVTVARTADKPNLACRLLAYDARVQTAAAASIALGPTLVYHGSVISGDAFSIPLLVEFPELPKAQYVVRLRVFVTADDSRTYDLALHCVSYTSLHGK